MRKIGAGAILVVCLVGIYMTVEAAIFDVTTTLELQNALIAAQANGEDDTINLAPGIYPVGSMLTYSPVEDEDYALTIQGQGAEITILDGGNTTSILLIDQSGLSEGANAHITIRGITFRNGNEKFFEGGAVSIANYSAETRIENCIFDRNASLLGGGGLYLLGSTSSIVGNEFIENSSSDLFSVGGAVYAVISGGTFTMEGNVLVDNFSVGSGGAVFVTNNGPIVLTGNVFIDNVAGGEGGGGYVSADFGGGLILSNNTFVGNSGSSSGGIFVATVTDPLVIRGNVFRGNVALASSQSQGGGLTAFSQHSLEMVNNLLVNNTTSQQGAGAFIHLFSNSNQITNNTFVGNTSTGTYGLTTSQGGGMYVVTDRNDAVLNIYNNIFWQNAAAAPSHKGADFYINDDGLNDGVGSTVKIYNNDYSNMDILRATNLSQGGNIINNNPLFDSDYRLTSGSPCKDTGNNTAPGLPSTDLGGDPRIQDGTVDMGAYEWGPRGLLQVTLSPQGAIDAGAQWRVDGGPWQESGHTESLLAGSYPVEFGDVPGWTKPADQNVTIAQGVTTPLFGEYTPVGPTGSLQVTISPQGAIDGGARWRVDGGLWHESGYTQTGLLGGDHTVWFNDVPGLATPPNQVVRIIEGGLTTTTGLYGGQIGFLRVTINPSQANAAGAHWRVDGGVWHVSGYTQTVSTGPHMVEFSDVAGWKKPANQVVNITAGSTTNATGTYTQPTGSLKVTITPEQAIADGARWRRVGTVAWRESGTTESGIPVGTHTVEFNDVLGWQKPVNRTVTISAGHLTEATGAYSPLPPGNLTVNIMPQAAIDAGAKWQLDGGTWHDSGETLVGLPTGEHMLSFSDVVGWAKPGDRTVQINSGATTAVTGTYVVSTETGSLQVTIAPQDVISAGAKWRVDGGDWHDSGETQSKLSVGLHTVEFNNVMNWAKPDNQTVTITKDQTTTTLGTYTPLPTGFLTVTINPEEVVSGGAQWRIDEWDWFASGETKVVSAGTHNLQFSDVPGWITPVPQQVTIVEGETTSASGTYTPQTGSLRIIINPSAAVDAGAKWRRVGTETWQDSGATESEIRVGSHTVEFRDIENWWKPANRVVTIEYNKTKTETATYSPHTGSLQVIITPQAAIDGGARWRRVGTSTWRTSGSTETGVPVGTQTIEFNPIPGWTKPANQTVTILVNQTAYATGTYTPPSGSLYVTISPPEAVGAGAKWRVDGGPWQDSGITLPGLSLGYHTISYSTIGGWTKPSNQTVRINESQTTTVTGVYKLQTGSLRVTISPQGAVDAGAKWRRVGTESWRDSGATEAGVPVGSHLVEFSDVSGWDKPDNRSVTISNSQTTSITASYTPWTGSLQVSISPPEAVAAGARWRVDGGPWQVSGSTQTGIPVGQHTVDFIDLPNWTKPSSLMVTIVVHETTTASATYAPPSGFLRVTITPSGAIAAGARWRRAGTEPWMESGQMEAGVPIGPQVVEFLELPAWTRPANRTVTITNGATTSITGTYKAKTGSLRVTIAPQGAVEAGAKWRRVGTAMWRDSGTTETSILVGEYSIEFKALSGWATPENQTVIILDKQTTEATGTYAPPSGSLQVTIDPPEVIAEGAKWRLDGGAWQESGVTIPGISVGLHTVSFSDVAGWKKPGNQTVTINNGQTTTTKGEYKK
jgi:hypothetical protein